MSSYTSDESWFMCVSTSVIISSVVSVLETITVSICVTVRELKCSCTSGVTHKEDKEDKN